MIFRYRKRTGSAIELGGLFIDEESFGFEPLEISIIGNTISIDVGVICIFYSIIIHILYDVGNDDWKIAKNEMPWSSRYRIRMVWF